MAVSVVQGGSFAHAEIVTDLRTPDKRLRTEKTRTKRASAAQNHPQESELSPNLNPLKGWVTDKLSARPKRWKDLTNDVREELWLGKHLNEVLKDMKRNDELEFEGKFVQTQNPLLRLAAKGAANPVT